MFQCVRNPGSPSKEWLTGKELAGITRRQPSLCGADRCRLEVAEISRRSQSRATSCCFRRRLWPLPCRPSLPKAEELQQVVAGADEQPFTVHLRQTPQEDLPEAPVLHSGRDERLGSHPDCERSNGGFDSVPAIRGAGTPGPSCLPHVAHCRPQGGHLTLPLLCAHLSPHAMTGEHPLHLQRSYKVHRVGQGRPREKGLFRKDVELAPAMIPVQRVAGKQEPVIHVVQDVAFGVPWRRDRQHTGRYVGCTLIAGLNPSHRALRPHRFRQSRPERRTAPPSVPRRPRRRGGSGAHG